MDDVLASNLERFRMLRAFWKVSFIKIDDDENKALRDIILKRNENYLGSAESTCTFNFDESLHEYISIKLTHNYKLISNNILNSCSDGDSIRHEMAIEAHIADLVTNTQESIFGKWDYVSHQVIASPFKPIDYMDMMDLFGFKYIQGYDTISKYLLIEIKKDRATWEAVNQVMKYVDWINQEYAFGDYSMINAFIVANDFSDEVIDYKKKVCKRNYIKGRRPTISDEWSNVKLIKYKYDKATSTLIFQEIKEEIV